MVADDKRRLRLARAVGEYWYDGAGPTHYEIDEVIDSFELNVAEGSKRTKVTESITVVPEDLLYSLLGEYVAILADGRYINDTEHPDFKRITRSLAAYGWSIRDGCLVGEGGIGVSPRQVPAVPAAREHIDRIERAISEGDDAQLLGSSKELLESVSKLVLSAKGIEPPMRFPALITAALEALCLHPKAPPTEREDQVEPVRKILGSVLQISISMNELRRDYGTGHGRASETAALDRRHARLAAGAAVVVATLMLDTFEDPNAPWRSSSA